MNQEIFADAISAVHVTGGLVRIDLMTLQPHLKSDNGQPVADISRRIIMPLAGFVQSLAVQDNIVKQLVEAGVLQKDGRPETEKTATAGSESDRQIAAIAAGEVDKEPDPDAGLASQKG